MISWRSTWSIYTRELVRFLRTAFQSVLAPVLTTSLYFIVFGAAIGGRSRRRRVRRRGRSASAKVTRRVARRRRAGAPGTCSRLLSLRGRQAALRTCDLSS